MKHCIEFEERVARYAGGDLDAGDIAAVERHLRDCPACAQLAAALTEDAEWLRGGQVEAAGADYGAMRSVVRQAIVRERWVKRLASLLLAAAAVLAVVTTATVRFAPTAHAPALQIAAVAVPTAAPEPPTRETEIGPVWPHPQIQSTAPSALDPLDAEALKAAMDELSGVEPPPEDGPVSPVEMRIATSDPSVVIILLQPTKEGFDE